MSFTRQELNELWTDCDKLEKYAIMLKDYNQLRAKAMEETAKRMKRKLETALEQK